MPLVRVEVRNEYGLGMPELYTETDREDPKAVLDGVAVAGLVGILRQLGDLAEFAAEVFHGLQEQVLITSSRSHKLVERVHNIEAALPPLEKSILAQRSHLHFAYTAGSHWHTRLRTEKNHFLYSDLPPFIMDSYEDCRDPPRLHKLDKFDIGGPGACFKRYSDPTYFKKASAGPYEAHLQSVSREKKARRNRKKRSSKYRDVTHDTPILTHGGGTDFGSSNIKEKTPPSQFVSPKSGTEPETEDHLSSVDDSRTGSGYIECIFRPSSSTQSEDNNAKEPSSDSNPNPNSFLDSTSIDENNTQNSYLPEHNRSRSSYITWDEKLEIIDSTSRPNEATEVSCTTDKVDTEDKEELNTRVVDHTDFDFDFHAGPVPTFVAQPDEIESETDYYMDALNTIESESETDMDCHTKRELQQNSSLNNKDAEGKGKVGSLDKSSENLVFHVEEDAKSPQSPHMEAYNKSTINEDAEGNRVISPQVATVSSSSLTSPEKHKSEEVERHETNSEKSPKPSVSTSSAHTTLSQPVMFWTNGTLLGLEPSKPPDFGLSTKNDSTQHSNQINTIDNDESSGKLTSQEHDLTPGSDSVPKESNEDSIGSSRIFEFSNRLLVNGFRRQISLVGDERLASSVRSEVPEKPAVTGKPFREQFGSETPLRSHSSPPLEHMRISFQPIDGFETSKLKLTFPDGNNNNSNNNNGTSGHMFPSFQLVPEPSVSLHESGSDSDDDTFCRSSPYASEDCHSHPSESNSDQWDEDEDEDETFGRVSSAESVSSSLVNGVRFHQGFPAPESYGLQSLFTMDGRLLDIPNLDSMNASLNGKEATPPPPPLPPMEWRGVKPHPCVTLEKEDALAEALGCTMNLTPPEPTVPQQPKPAPLKPDRFVETVENAVKQKQSEWQNLNVQNVSSRPINAKVTDEKEDFLQQIRTKSRNLRRTSTTQPTTTPPGPNNVKVTAILEKANAIRQVVGSDDGEDDNWSDT